MRLYHINIELYINTNIYLKTLAHIADKRSGYCIALKCLQSLNSFQGFSPEQSRLGIHRYDSAHTDKVGGPVAPLAQFFPKQPRRSEIASSIVQGGHQRSLSRSRGADRRGLGSNNQPPQAEKQHAVVRCGSVCRNRKPSLKTRASSSSSNSFCVLCGSRVAKPPGT